MKGPSGHCVLQCDGCLHLHEKHGLDYDGPRTWRTCSKKHNLPIHGGTPDWCPLLYLARVTVYPKRKGSK